MAPGPSSKPEFPPIFSVGFHSTTLKSLKLICVKKFLDSKTRADIMAGLESVVGRLQSDGIKGDIWVDGSFLIEKIDPADVDILLRLEQSFLDDATDTQNEAIDWFHNNLKAEYYCDSYILAESSKDPKRKAKSEWDKSYWHRQFGFSRGNEYKGIAVLTI